MPDERPIKITLTCNAGQYIAGMEAAAAAIKARRNSDS